MAAPFQQESLRALCLEALLIIYMLFLVICRFVWPPSFMIIGPYHNYAIRLSQYSLKPLSFDDGCGLL